MIDKLKQSNQVPQIFFVTGIALLTLSFLGILLLVLRKSPREIRILDVSQDETTPLGSSTFFSNTEDQLNQSYDSSSEYSRAISGSIESRTTFDIKGIPQDSVTSILVYRFRSSSNPVLKVRPTQVSISDTILITYSITNNGEDNDCFFTVNSASRKSLIYPPTKQGTDIEQVLASGETWSFSLPHAARPQQLMDSTVTVTSVNRYGKVVTSSVTYELYIEVAGLVNLPSSFALDNSIENQPIVYLQVAKKRARVTSDDLYEYLYDENGNISEVIHPTGGVVRYLYDEEGNLTRRVDELGYVTHYRYNSDKQLVSVTTSDGEVLTREDDLGQITRTVIEYTYDSLGRLTAVERTDGEFERYEYDAAGNRITIQPQEFIEVEWPEKLEVNRSDSVRISFFQTTDESYVPYLEVDDNQVTSTTPIPAGTPGAELNRAFGVDYEGFASANLVGTAFNIIPVTSQEQSLVQDRITWEWNIISDMPGEQVLNAIIEIEWRSTSGSNTVQRQVWRQRLDVQVEDPLIPTNVLGLFTGFSSVLGTVFSFPWVYRKVKQWKKNKSRMKQQPLGKSKASVGSNSEARSIKILFLAANPTNTTRLRLDEECREIDETLRQSEFRERFKIQQHWAVRVTDLQGYLLRYKPDIVHFSGHGAQSSEIILEDNTGRGHLVSSRALSQLFSVLQDNIRCVVLNACYSETQAKAVAEHIDCVIGMSKAIGDRSAISFATAFYQALGYGRDVKTAFDLGCIQIDMEQLKEQDTPRLLAIRSNPETIVFVRKSQTNTSSSTPD